MICRVLRTRQKAAKNASSRIIYYLNPPWFPKKFFFISGGQFQPVIFFLSAKKMSTRKKIKNAIRLENHSFKCAFFLGGEPKNLWRLNGNLAIPKCTPNPITGSKLRVKSKKMFFWSPTLGGAGRL